MSTAAGIVFLLLVAAISLSAAGRELLRALPLDLGLLAVALLIWVSLRGPRFAPALRIALA